jgi:hypothetical protein
MKSKYSEDRILQALDEISKDKEASKKLWNDICKVTAEHIRSWLERTERLHNRVEGIIIEKNGYFRMLCPKCNSVHPATVTFCNQCGVQLQDTLLLKNPEEESHGIGLTSVLKFPLAYTKININVNVSVSKGELRRRSHL